MTVFTNFIQISEKVSHRDKKDAMICYNLFNEPNNDVSRYPIYC